MRTLRVGIDTGGTFTDFVLYDGDSLRVHKVPSTPDDPARAVIEGIGQLVTGAFEGVHGSTVATNALLERRGAPTALVTTEGFEDLLIIGRQARSGIYDIDVRRPAPLTEHTFGLKERLGPTGEVLTRLSDADADAVAERLVELDIAAVAVCLLHSYANPTHEQKFLELLRERGFPGFCCASHQVLPEFREYERCSTTVINAYVGPVMAEYLDRLEQSLGGGRLHVMQSNGGALSIQAARRHAVHTILSGPAGGVVGAVEIAAAAGYDHVITFDMGGTSTDVALCPGEPSRTNEAEIGGLPIRVPLLDIHTVGAGGGSVAWIDPGGALRVGPRSAGAVPGPACYGRDGSDFTVTDANLLLGRICPHRFLGGESHLSVDAAASAARPLADRLHLQLHELAQGVVDVADATMAGALRVISVQRGYDPRDFTLMCFGGAGGMHAASLATALGIPRVLVPPAPGTLSAYGMLVADAVRDYSRSLLQPVQALRRGQLDAAFAELESQARVDELLSHRDRTPVLVRAVDMRYRGQGFELTIPYSDQFVDAFHDAHEQRYGYSDQRREVEVVTVRVQARAPMPRPQIAPRPLVNEPIPADASEDWQIHAGGTVFPARLVQRDRLHPGHRLAGPALLVEYSATTYLPDGWTARVDPFANLLLEPTR